eukprot:CAMPEP_0197246634 /NCGR_PEP_ID=MMETSP1429-20130617/18397_1 /TAXON_ID=49237 /ORGANISM="Chaetoceros  sp., Strain UNC1202" /LENGTH=207 /DNA_ID=CAMNT_0042707345 /DNA_START=96 /DNA_END=719 /DNA_ORIENTATION=+
MADEQTSAFFQPMDDGVGDEPIFLGAPAPAPTGDYIGEIDAAPPAVMIAPAPEAEAPAEYAPIILGHGVEEVLEEEPSPFEEPASPEPMELSPMAVFNNEWQNTLRERKDEENAQKGAAIESSERELAEIQAQREAKKDSRMQKNRGDEQDKLEAIEADLEHDNSWQRVVKMVELNQDSLEGSADCTRMKDVLILLKNDPDRAAILA